MTVIEFRDRIIEDGIASVEKTEKGAKKKGGLKGFAIARACSTAADFQRQLQARHLAETKMIGSEPDVDAYWEHRYATLQIEFVYDRMRIAWGINGMVSASAMLHYERITRGTPPR